MNRGMHDKARGIHAIVRWLDDVTVQVDLHEIRRFHFPIHETERIDQKVILMSGNT